MRNRMALRAWLVAGAIFAFSTTQAQANLIVNGSFESGVNAPAAVPGFRTLSGPGDPLAFGGTSDLTGWTVTDMNVDWIHSNYWQPSQGTYSLDLSGWAPGGVSQTVSTNVGETYTLTFDLSVNPDDRHSDTARRLDVWAVNDATNLRDLEENRLIGRGNRTFTDMQWQQVSFTFTATGTSTSIRLFSSPDNIDAGGPAIDNVTLLGNGSPNVVPAPAGLVLAGVGGLGLLIARRRKVATPAAA
jgi:choice-of-anchor C domain-containing protein